MRPMICASDRLNPGLFEGEGAALHLSKKKKLHAPCSLHGKECSWFFFLVCLIN